MDNSELQVAIISSPGIGHLTPIISLGHRLIATHSNVHVTVLVISKQLSTAESQLFNLHSSSTKNLDFVQIPQADISTLIDANTKVVTQLCMIMRETLQNIRSAILNMNRQPDILIVDLFGTELLPIAEEFGMQKYVFIASNAWFVSLLLCCQVFDKEIVGEFVDHKEPLVIPGCKPVRPVDLVDPMMDRSDQQYFEIIRIGVEFSYFDGILVNTWEDLERTTIEALKNDEILRSLVKAPVYPIGPLTNEPPGSETELMLWLDAQPIESVIYVSFGSGGTLSAQQMTELAWGLELSQQRFIWVVRPPIEDHADEAFFTQLNGSDYLTYLPDDFMKRTHKRGKVVPNWAPQREILSHPSVGGFISHCGWNSTLESLTNGVPIVAWPLYAEQRMNATMLAEEFGVAVCPEKLPSEKVVGREEIEKIVRSVMEEKEGKEMREKVKKVKCSGEKAISRGSSYKSLSEVIEEWRRKKQDDVSISQII